MGPVIEGIAECMRNRGSPCLELREGVSITGAEPLRNTVRAHGAPFVVVPLEPDLKKVFKLPVLGDIARRKVAVVVENGLFFGELMIEPPRNAALQQKLLVNETHTVLSVLSRLFCDGAGECAPLPFRNKGFRCRS